MTRSSRGTALRWSSAREEEEDNVLPTPIVRNARHCVPSDIFRPSLTTSPRSFLATLSFRERLRFSSWHINRRRSLANIGIPISLQLTSERMGLTQVYCGHTG